MGSRDGQSSHGWEWYVSCSVQNVHFDKATADVILTTEEVFNGFVVLWRERAKEKALYNAAFPHASRSEDDDAMSLVGVVHVGTLFGTRPVKKKNEKRILRLCYSQDFRTTFR